MKILLTADVHIGRMPSRIPVARAKDFSCSKVWEKLIRLAVSEKVRAVIVAGDLVDAANRLLEAAGALEAGLKQLQAAGIDLILTAGNHDVQVVAELGRIFPLSNLKIAGENGVWDIFELTDAETGEAVQVAGWSFPRSGPVTCPLPTFPHEQVETDKICLGILHSDYGSPGSPYCGSSGPDFDGLPVGLWVLGHLHQPMVHTLRSGTRLLIPGSPQGMDPGRGEAGIHGPWLLETGVDDPADGAADTSRVVSLAPGVRMRQIPLGELCYDTLELTIDGDTDPAALPRLLRERVRLHVAELQDIHPGLRSLALRMCISGRSNLSPRMVHAQFSELLDEPFDVMGVQVDIENIEMNIQPDLDLESLAGCEGVIGLLARAASGALAEEESDYLLGRYAVRARQIVNDRCFNPLSGDLPATAEGPDDQSLRRWAVQLLDDLIE